MNGERSHTVVIRISSRTPWTASYTYYSYIVNTNGILVWPRPRINLVYSVSSTYFPTKAKKKRANWNELTLGVIVGCPFRENAFGE